MSAPSVQLPALEGWRRHPLLATMWAYLELTKPDITLLVVITAAAAFWLGARHPVDRLQLLHVLVGIAALSSGIGAMNHYLEREIDARMRRTKGRPLPSGRLRPRQALIFGLGLSAFAELYLLVFLNPLTALLGALAFASYLFAYTPLKTRTTLCTTVGAIPGAMPALMGWTASGSEIGIGAWILFAILFLWQFPHFFAIAWMYREDYARAGIRMLPVVDPDGHRTGRQIVLYTLLLVGVSILPTFVKLSGSHYLVGALLLGGYFLWESVRAAHTHARGHARRVLKASILYLPLLLGLMCFDPPSLP
ncbi:MAG: heme o synthase [Blastocatellia bacterium]|nr:heme o synthase [Blastocatellia bacterium]MCS7158280.1 heme o synthase [Blastocatellia bacterium]MCX7753118.1 heme o synthase [Blastocatellia bacterium]MDW8169432.1 heme o synthase [Acidobacteriota bacterium]MDW8255707.1 heme o synthase [Acidobacteriota bacterium]